MKLKNTKTFKLFGNLYVIEVYEDYSIEIKLIENGIVDYILHGSDLPITI